MYWLFAWRHQAITWTNTGSFCIVVSVFMLYICLLYKHNHADDHDEWAPRDVIPMSYKRQMVKSPATKKISFRIQMYGWVPSVKEINIIYYSYIITFIVLIAWINISNWASLGHFPKRSWLEESFTGCRINTFPNVHFLLYSLRCSRGSVYGDRVSRKTHITRTCLCFMK